MLYIYSITQSTSPPAEVGIIILSPYESKRSHLRLSEIEGKTFAPGRGAGHWLKSWAANRALCHRDVEATSAWSLLSFLTGCHMSVQHQEDRTRGFMFFPLSFWDKPLSLKKDLLPSECQDKKTFSDFPCKLQTPISTQDLRKSLTSCQPLWIAFMVQGGVVTGPCHYHRVCCSFMSLGFDKSLLQPVPLQHTERKIKEQYQTRSWGQTGNNHSERRATDCSPS